MIGGNSTQNTIAIEFYFFLWPFLLKQVVILDTSDTQRLLSEILFKLEISKRVILLDMWNREYNN